MYRPSSAHLVLFGFNPRVRGTCFESLLAPCFPPNQGERFTGIWCFNPRVRGTCFERFFGVTFTSTAQVNAVLIPVCGEHVLKGGGGDRVLGLLAGVG